MKKPNVVYVFADQWRAQATGYFGNPDVQTPNIDWLARESMNLTHAVAGCSVCSPSRASLLTGQYPLTHGVFVNDVQLSSTESSLAGAYKQGGYNTAYIGKWHVDGRGRSNYIPPERRQGFDYWKVLECTHDYNHSSFYAGDSGEKLLWDGYDAIAQTRDAQQYIQNCPKDRPFLLVLSWGPPHAPYETAPEEYRQLYQPEKLRLRQNVPPAHQQAAREWLAGYYAHCTALDDCIGNLRQTLADEGIADDSIFVFSSDHGDMLGSHGMDKKQKPWDESIRIPLLVHYPARFGTGGIELNIVFDTPDVLPTLLGLCNLPIPDTVEGADFSGCFLGGQCPSDGAALLTCYHPFGQWPAAAGGREYRGLRSTRYTYVRTLDGPWLLYDNKVDPYQLYNRVDDARFAALRFDLEERLQRKLAELSDDFLRGVEYIRQWSYPLDETGTVPYSR